MVISALVYGVGLVWRVAYPLAKMARESFQPAQPQFCIAVLDT